MKIDLTGDTISKDFCLFRTTEKEELMKQLSSADHKFPHVYYQLSFGLYSLAIIKKYSQYYVYQSVAFEGSHPENDGFYSDGLTFINALKKFDKLMCDFCGFKRTYKQLEIW